MLRFGLAFAMSLAAAGAAFGQLIVGVDDTFDNDIYLIDVSDDTSSSLFSGLTVWGLAADDANRILYSVYGQSLYSISYDAPTPVLLGDIQEGGQNRSMVGLAFDPSSGKLYGSRAIANEGVYEIDLGTLEATLIVDYVDADYDFGGLACDPDTGKFYGTNDDLDAFGGRGLYEINLVSGAITFVAGYPGGETDIDGLAIGGGRAFLATDEPGSIYVWDLALSAWLSPLTSPIAPFSTTTYSGAAWAPGLFAGECVADIDGDGIVDLTDLGILLINFGIGTLPGEGDVSGDGTVDLTDLGMLLLDFGATCPPACPSDVDGDRTVDLTDLGILLLNFGSGTLPEEGDVNGDGVIDLTDLGILLVNFGTTCP